MMVTADSREERWDCLKDGHDWESKEISANCDTCSFKAGAGDWGMCMPDAGSECIQPTVRVKECRHCGAIQTEDGLVVPSDFFDKL